MVSLYQLVFVIYTAITDLNYVSASPQTHFYQYVHILLKFMLRFNILIILIIMKFLNFY